MKRTLLLFSLFLFTNVGLTSFAYAQEWETPRIKGYGKVKYFSEAAEQPNPEDTYHLLFDITSTKEKDGVNQRLWVMARTLNMLAVSEVPNENIKLVGAIHGEATFIILTNEAYQNKYGTSNPNIDLINKLIAAGTQLYVCSQATASRGVSPDMVLPSITPALSALSVLSNYQNRGFHLMP